MQSIEKGVGRAANSMVSDHRSVIIEVKKKKDNIDVWKHI